MSEEQEDSERLTATRDEEGQRVFKTSLTPQSQKGVKILQAKQRAAIPLVFLPGIMGSNLKNKKTGDAVWRPPNASLRPGDVMSVFGALVTWGFRGGKRRQELLTGDKLTVDNRGSIDVGKSGLNKKTAKSRGWGTVMRSSYNPVMALLEQRLEGMVVNQQVATWWQEEGKRDPADYGEEQGGNDALDDTQLAKAARYEFDVWCCGYNWLNSNRQSGLDVIEYINNVVLKYYQDQGVPAEKVILVTHSMGGLVSRAVTQIHKCERVLGVVHGVQPATGAPAIYHHMRCGYEGVERIILGKNAGDVTAVVANSAGALELIPTQDHRNSRPWLFTRTDETAQSVAILPNSTDPYTDIYMSSEWYGLVPEQNTKYLDMSPDSNNPNPDKSSRQNFNDLIDAVRDFHNEIVNGYHGETYAHYGADNGEKMHSWQDIIWQGDVASIQQNGVTANDDGRGSYQSKTASNGPTLTAPSNGTGAGDGTVSVFSGEAPARAGVKASFRHGSLGKGQYATAAGYNHQDSYNDPRAQWACLYGILRIAQNANWSPQDTSQ